MGDRAVIGFKADADDVPVFLYMHWGGSDRYQDAMKAIEGARSRWDDPAYATRVGISQIVADNWSRDRDFGISAGHDSFCQPDYDDVILITWGTRSVEVVSAGDSTKVSMAMPFDSFLAQLV